MLNHWNNNNLGKIRRRGIAIALSASLAVLCAADGGAPVSASGVGQPETGDISMIAGIKLSGNTAASEWIKLCGDMASPESPVLPDNTVSPGSTAVPEGTVPPGGTAVPEGTVPPGGTAVPEGTVPPGSTAAPEGTVLPEGTVPPGGTAVPEETALPENTQEPKRVKKLGKVTGVTVTRYSSHEVKVNWKKVKKAKRYRVCVAKNNKKGNYKTACVTTEQQALIGKLKKNAKYYIAVQACEKKKASESDGRMSKRIGIKMRAFQRKVIFAGDSITEALKYYPVQWNMSGQKEVVAAVGLNTVTFHTKRVFGGLTGLQKVIAEKPYRVYMMLGVNEVHYRPAGDMIKDYRELVRSIQQGSPDTDIVLCAIAPVTLEERQRTAGFWQIAPFNRKLKKLAKQTGTGYYDNFDFLKDSNGYLRYEYAEKDGYHWKPPVYIDFSRSVSEFDKGLDR